MTRRAVSSDQAPDALGPYSQAIVASGLVFCSGMAGIDPATGAIADGIAAQTEQALLNLAAVLSAAGSSMDNCGLLVSIEAIAVLASTST
jgi:2-iminobutanoate/2-iminopropanoate deaminase